MFGVAVCLGSLLCFRGVKRRVLVEFGHCNGCGWELESVLGSERRVEGSMSLW